MFCYGFKHWFNNQPFSYCFWTSRLINWKKIVSCRPTYGIRTCSSTKSIWAMYKNAWCEEGFPLAILFWHTSYEDVWYASTSIGKFNGLKTNQKYPDFVLFSVKILVKDEVIRYADSITSSLIKMYTAGDDPEIKQVKELTKSLINRYICASVDPLKRLEVSSYDYTPYYPSRL